jgi:hypothetical protein
MSPGKTVGPATTLTFFGIELDTEKQEARLPDEKLEKCFLFGRSISTQKKDDFGRNSLSLWSTEFCMSGNSHRTIIFEKVVRVDKRVGET